MAIHVESRLSDYERAYNKIKFPELYTLLVESFAELVISSYIAGYPANNSATQLGELCAWFNTNTYIPNMGAPSISPILKFL